MCFPKLVCARKEQFC